MAYTIIDVLDKLIYVTEKKKESCFGALGRAEKVSPVYVLSNVLMKSLNRSIEYYKQLKEEVNNIDEEVIDFVIYDKISFLINEFNAKGTPQDMISTKDMVKSCLDFQKDVLALYIDIRGRLVKNEEDVKTKAYKIMSTMIEKKQKTIEELEDFIKKYNF